MSRTTEPSLPVVADQLSMDYGTKAQPVRALRGVSVSAAKGELVAIIGASGSGKSTLLHLMGGLIRPTSGRVKIDGMDLADMSDRKLTLFRRERVGLVFQAFNLVPTLTMRDNIQLPLLMQRGGAAHAERVDELIDMLGLKDRQQHRPDQLSGGEQQRVAIGRALVNNPSVVLADEPTGNLDSVNGQKLCELIRSLCDEQQRTIVMVTHDPAVAIWADRVLVLRDGQLIDELRTIDFASPSELGVRAFELMSAAPTEAPVCV